MNGNDVTTRRSSHGRVLTGLVVLTFGAVVIDLAAGRAFGPGRLLAALADPSSTDGSILYLARMPRVATAVIAGASLGVAGVVLQTILSNPLASPELTGVNGCSVLGVVVAIWSGAVTVDGAAGPLLAALIGGLAGGLVTLLVAGSRQSSQVLIVGVLIAAASAGATILLLSLKADAFGIVNRWLIGSVDARTWGHLALAAPWVVCVLIVVVLVAGPLRLLAAGPAHAAALGVDVPRARTALMGAAVALVAGATAIAGAISFVGLAVPHLVRRLADGSAPTAVLPMAGLCGAMLLVGCDALAQVCNAVLSAVAPSINVPAGAVAALLGAVAVVLVARKEVTA